MVGGKAERIAVEAFAIQQVVALIELRGGICGADAMDQEIRL